jgi:hypothetical protein
MDCCDEVCDGNGKEGPRQCSRADCSNFKHGEIQMNYQAMEFALKAILPEWSVDEIYDMSSRSFLCLIEGKLPCSAGQHLDDMTEEEQRMYLLFMAEYLSTEFT